MLKTKSFLAKLALRLILVAVIIVFAYSAFNAAESKYAANGLKTTKDAIFRAAVACYAIEGFFPPNDEYLRENYGLIINDKYIIHYYTYGSNVMPEIDVFLKTSRGISYGK